MEVKKTKGKKIMKSIYFPSPIADDMIRSILENRKTVMRRVVKPQPEKSAHSPYECVGGRFAFRIGEYASTRQYERPYHFGEVLYVKETFAPNVDGGFYKADGIDDVFGGWRPSIHMPQEAARIFLRVTGVRVEKLQEIKIEDVLAEGITPIDRLGGCKCQWAVDGCLERPCANRDSYEFERHIKPYSELWDKFLKPADRALYGWEANPWVFVTEFERISKQ